MLLQNPSNVEESVGCALDAFLVVQEIKGVQETQGPPQPSPLIWAQPSFGLLTPSWKPSMFPLPMLTTDSLGTFWGGSDKTSSMPPMSVSEIPRLMRFFVPVAFSARSGHFFMWETVALLEEL